MESGINAAPTVASSQKAGKLPCMKLKYGIKWCKMPEACVRESAKRGHFEAFTPRKSTFMDATAARGFMPDGTVVTFTQRFRGLVMI